MKEFMERSEGQWKNIPELLGGRFEGFMREMQAY
jgi:hypothetical protein